MPANGQRTAPEHHTLYYVEDDTAMIFLTHDLKTEYRLIEAWYHEDFLEAHLDPRHREVEDFNSTEKEATDV